jgi:hypothetical protein
MTPDRVFSCCPDSTVGSGRWHGFPYSGMILIGCLVVGGLALAKTVYGQSIYAVGGNAEASRLSGLRVSATIGSAYVLSGLSMGVAGIITASQLSSAQANINPDIVFDVTTIVVVGGTSLAGGLGRCGGRRLASGSSRPSRTPSAWPTSIRPTRTSSRGASSSVRWPSTRTPVAWPAVRVRGRAAQRSGGSEWS